MGPNQRFLRPDVRVYFILRPLILAITNINTFIIVMTIFIVVLIFSKVLRCAVTKSAAEKKKKFKKFGYANESQKPAPQQYDGLLRLICSEFRILVLYFSQMRIVGCSGLE